MEREGLSVTCIRVSEADRISPTCVEHIPDETGLSPIMVIVPSSHLTRGYTGTSDSPCDRFGVMLLTTLMKPNVGEVGASVFEPSAGMMSKVGIYKTS